MSTQSPTRPTPDQLEKSIPPPMRIWIEAVLNQRLGNLPKPVAPKNYERELLALRLRIQRLENLVQGGDIEPALRVRMNQIVDQFAKELGND